MPKTLLNAVNETLKRVKIIAGDSGELTSLTDSSRQTFIDTAVQVINEGIDELYTACDLPMPEGQGEATVTLAASTRAYALRDDMVRLRFPLIDRTNRQFITEFAGGYNAMLEADFEQDDTGLPIMAAIRPTDGRLHMDRTPTATEAGRIYTYQYDKDAVIELASDCLPFNNTVFRAMVPVWSGLWSREQRRDFDAGVFDVSIGRAARLMTQRPPRNSWWSGA